MSDPTQHSPLLSLPYIQGAQAQKHVTHNEAIERLDLVVQLTLEATGTTTPPNTATEGQAWVVGAGATGTWTSQVGNIAAWRGGGWLFVTPQTGWRAWDKASGTIMVFDGTDWTQTGGGGGSAVTNFNNLPGVGVNATSDTTNRLVVASDATLLTHDGSGHQLKINKNASTDTASLLYQSNWSGRAEMGLAGNDDFAIKVSSDGTTFTDALRIDAATGAVAMPTTGTRQLLQINYRYYLYADKRWIGASSNSGTQDAAQSLGTGTEPDLNWDGTGLYLPAGTQVNGFTLTGSLSSGQVLDMDLRLRFKYGSWNGGWDSNTSFACDTLYSANSAGISGASGMQKAICAFSYTTPTDGYFATSMRVGAASILTGTRFFYSMGALDVTLPPSA